MYQLQKDKLDNKVVSVLRQQDGASIPVNEANTDYQAYLEWLAEGNEVLPADEPVQE
jgi:hypothetical protein